MKRFRDALVDRFLQLVDPVAALLVRLNIAPNTLTTTGTVFTVAGGVAFALGAVRTAGFIIGAAAFFDVLDGMVARKGERSTMFGAFYDSTLDRLADGALLGGLALFYATSPTHRSPMMVAVAISGMIGTFLVSYTRARAEALGIALRVGFMQRAERIVLLSVPQALFGLALDGAVLTGVVSLVAISAWITATQRVLYVRRATGGPAYKPLRVLTDRNPLRARFASRRAQS
jgi:CDP-diacylglycerol--glycerol-3-phosphate 3-phosphatidyltransferase